MMDQKRLDEIRARCDAATPGPWEHDGMHDEVHGQGEDYFLIIEELPDHPDAVSFDVYGHRVNPNYVFAAHARQDIPDLLDEVERLHNSLKELTSIVSTLQDDILKLRRNTVKGTE